MYFLNMIRKKSNNLKVLFAIRKKWKQDCLQLPLSTAHWELYSIIHRLCWRELGQFPDLVNCRGFNDRIQWLKLFDQDEKIIECTDKLKARKYISSRIGSSNFTQIYQVESRFEDLNINELPKSFVIKTNNDSGSYVLVLDKSNLDMEAAKDKIDYALSRMYGWNNAEWAYAYIKPYVFVEEFIEPESGSPPIDYRFHCVNGRVAWVQIDIPGTPKMSEVTVDPLGVPMGVHFSTHKIYSEKFVKPETWDEMLHMARKISHGWKYVRVDMFSTKKKIFVGEMTFYPYCGTYKGEGQMIMGRFLDFDRTTYKPLLIPRLEKENSRFNVYPAVKSLK